MKKKSLIALLALIVACMFVFAACGDKADTNNGGSIADNTEASTELTTDENGEVFTPNEGTPLPLPTDNVTEPTEVTEPTTPAENTPSYSVGSVSYKLIEEGYDNAYVAVTLMYDENRNVTELIYTASAENDQFNVDAINDVYDVFEQAKGIGCNITTNIIETDNEYRLEATILVLNEVDIVFVEGMFEEDFPGTTIVLDDAESFLILEGFEKV